MARILIAVDGSPPSQQALEYGATLAAKLGVGVVLLHAMPQVAGPVMDGGSGAVTELQKSLQTEGLHLLESLADRGRSHGVEVETELGVGEPAIAIYDRAEMPDIELVVMGNRGQGAVARLLLGSEASKVVHTSTRPVVVVHAGGPGGSAMRRILVAVDGTEVAREAARTGLELAGRVGARVTLVHVLPPSVDEGETADFSAFERACEDYASGLLAEMRQLTGRSGPPTDISVLHGDDPAAAIARAAEAEDVDLVIVGTRARGALARTLLGSVADTLLPRCPKPLMVVPEAPKKALTPEERAEEELAEALDPSTLGVSG